MYLKLIIVICVAIILLGGGVYYFMNQPESATPPAPQAAGPQVAGQDAVVGTGSEAVPGSVVSVLYVGMLQDGTVFDSSAANGNQPLTFPLGAPGIIPGFQIGVRGMKEGGERRISIPPELGYGTQEVKDASGKVVIPANATLLFDIKLVKVDSAATSTPQ